ncbi:MAG: MOSC domain-containing protein, partial [Rhodoglobus sp.]|nr:MOSC domain-containing protein [Rhodoglobus sp.]
QAIYAFQREDLDRWEQRLERTLTNGFFGENLTTVGLDVNATRIGTVWRIGDTVEVQVTSARLPCNTFRGWIGEKGWLKSFTADARPGAYLRILTPGFITAGDAVQVVNFPDSGPTVTEDYLIGLGLE